MPDKATTGFMRSLCMGQIEQDVLFPFPVMSSDQKETLHEIAGAIEDLLGPRSEEFRQWDADGNMPVDFIDQLKDFGLFSLIIPEDHGAMGEEKASREIEILRVFTSEARVRIKQNFRHIDDNEDELLKALAKDAFNVERFRWDTI